MPDPTTGGHSCLRRGRVFLLLDGYVDTPPDTTDGGAPLQGALPGSGVTGGEPVSAGDLLPTAVPMQVDVRDHRITPHAGPRAAGPRGRGGRARPRLRRGPGRSPPRCRRGRHAAARAAEGPFACARDLFDLPGPRDVHGPPAGASAPRVTLLRPSPRRGDAPGPPEPAGALAELVPPRRHEESRDAARALFGSLPSAGPCALETVITAAGTRFLIRSGSAQALTAAAAQVRAAGRSGS